MIIPAIRCPACQRTPRLRAAAALVELAATVPPATPLHSYQCVCGRTYDLTAAAYRPPRARTA
ncbi:MAG: hypothetical protein JWM27_4722 [Gemmatimonadetes bacterium]|nr:hypothetical protein [Gemmatimonadota bacterium]